MDAAYDSARKDLAMKDVDTLVNDLPQGVLDAFDVSAFSTEERKALMAVDPGLYERLFRGSDDEREAAKRELFRELFQRGANARARIERDRQPLAS